MRQFSCDLGRMERGLLQGGNRSFRQRRFQESRQIRQKCQRADAPSQQDAQPTLDARREYQMLQSETEEEEQGEDVRIEQRGPGDDEEQPFPPPRAGSVAKPPVEPQVDDRQQQQQRVHADLMEIEQDESAGRQEQSSQRRRPAIEGVSREAISPGDEEDAEEQRQISHWQLRPADKTGPLPAEKEVERHMVWAVRIQGIYDFGQAVSAVEYAHIGNRIKLVKPQIIGIKLERAQRKAEQQHKQHRDQVRSVELNHRLLAARFRARYSGANWPNCQRL